MKVETDGNRVMIEAGPGMRQAALDAAAVYFHEFQKTRRLLIIAATVFSVVAAMAVLFAPEGRDTTAQWTGLSLLILAIVSGGYSRVWMKIGPLEIKCDDSERGSG